MKATSFQGVAVVLAAPPLPPHRATNWSDADDAFMAERNAESATHKMGVDGKMAVFLSSDKSGKFTLKFFQTSPTNKYLMSVCALMEGGPGSFVPIQITFVDTYRQDKALGIYGYVVKPAPIARGKEVKEQTWELQVENMQPFFGDPNFAQFATSAAEGQ